MTLFCIVNYTKRDIILIMKRGERLKQRRIELGFTMRQAAELLDLSVSGVQNLEKDEVMPNLKLGMAIGRIYNKSLQWIVDGVDVIEDKIPILGNTQAGPDAFWKKIDYHDNNFHEYIKFNSMGRKLYGLRVMGDSMSILYPEGDIILIDPEIEPIIGEDVIIKFKTGEIMIKRLLRFDKDYIYLDSLNDNFKRMIRLKNDIEFIHTIVGSIKSFMIEHN